MPGALFPQTARAVFTSTVKSNNTLYPIQARDFTIGTPAPFSNGTARNTQVVVTATGLDNFIKQSTLFYERTDLGLFFSLAGLTPLITLNNPVTAYDLLPIILSQYGINLAQEDVIQEDVPQADTYLLKANPNSLGWIGSVSIALDFTVSPPAGFKFMVMNNQLVSVNGKLLLVRVNS